MRSTTFAISLRLVDALGLLPGALRAHAVDLGDARLGGLLGEVPRLEVVAQIAASDRDDIAAVPEMLDIDEENRLHATGLGHERAVFL